MIVDSDDDTSCTVLFNKIIRPTIREGEWVELDTRRSEQKGGHDRSNRHLYDIASHGEL